jgi:hypothetical protein
MSTKQSGAIQLVLQQTEMMSLEWAREDWGIKQDEGGSNGQYDQRS